MRAYKGFHKDLNCTMGKGVFYYEPGKWYREQEARCADTGFHATDNPLEVLRWYSNEGDRYFAVELRGNIDEDGCGSRIAAPEIMLVKELTIDDLYRFGVLWMSKHPKAELAAAVMVESGEAYRNGNVIVRGKNPRARGKAGDNLYIVRDDVDGGIVEIGAFKVDGIKILPDVYYDAKGRRVNEKK